MNSAYKVALIRPPKIMGALERSMVQHPINLLSLAAVVRAAGFAPEVWDLEVEPNSEAAIRRRAQAARPDLGCSCRQTHLYVAGPPLPGHRNNTPKGFHPEAKRGIWVRTDVGE